MDKHSMRLRTVWEKDEQPIIAKKVAWRGDPDEDFGPKRVRFSYNSYHRTWLDARSQLDGFLRKHVGVPWDTVWSQLCHFTPSPYQRRELRRCLRWKVLQQTYTVNGWRHEPGYSWPFDGFYVDDDGILQYQSCRRKRGWWQHNEIIEEVVISDTQKFVLCDGFWFLHTYTKYAYTYMVPEYAPTSLQKPRTVSGTTLQSVKQLSRKDTNKLIDCLPKAARMKRIALPHETVRKLECMKKILQ